MNNEKNVVEETMEEGELELDIKVKQLKTSVRAGMMAEDHVSMSNRHCPIDGTED